MYGGAGGYTQQYSGQQYAGGFGGEGYPSAGVAKVEPVGNAKHCVVMSGVDISTSVGDVIKFFANVVQPKNVEVKYDGGCGSVVVDFYTHADAMKAMLRDKEQLGKFSPWLTPLPFPIDPPLRLPKYLVPDP